MENLKTYTGGCHCGKVRYEIKTDLTEALECNCSICSKTGTLLSFISSEQFTLLSGQEELSDYQFNKKIIHHLFCKNCGIRSFARGKGQDGQEMIAINIRCLDDVDISKLKQIQFDGKNAS